MGTAKQGWVTAASLALLAITGCAAGGVADTAPAIAAEPPALQSAAATPAPTEAPAPTPASIAPPSFTPDGVAALEARMAQFVTDGHVAGIETLLVQSGEVVSHYMSGIRDAQTGAPITDDTIYRIYSMTKPVTGVAMMMLYEEGAFALDDPITDYFPEFEGLMVWTGQDADGNDTYTPVNRAPTVQELMSHQAGFAYGLFGDDPANTAMRERAVLAAPDLGTFIQAISDLPLLFQPGEAWYYSVAVDIQGAMVERLTGQSFGDFLDDRLFTPLGMDDTGFTVPEADRARFSDVWGYHPETGDFVPLPREDPRFSYSPETAGMESGGGGLVATMADYARFSQMLLNGGELDGVRILQPETVDLMRTNVLADGVTVDVTGTLTESDAATQRFGLNVGVYENTAEYGLPMGEGTYYWGGAAGTWFWIDPVNDLYFIGMIQRFATGAPEPVDFWGASGEAVYAAMATGSDTETVTGSAN